MATQPTGKSSADVVTTPTKKVRVMKAPVSAALRAKDILTKAVLTQKVTKEELETLSEHINKLVALV